VAQQSVDQPTTLSLAVLSDIHAYDRPDGSGPPSYVCTATPHDEYTTNPIAGLLRLISDTRLQTDVLICGGDMCDKARPAGVNYVWDKLQVLKQALGAQLLAAAPGNHDLDSRYTFSDFDCKGVLQGLKPAFPLPDEVQNDKFWARNYVVHTDSLFRLVVLNSSAYHGTAADEFKHGRIAPRTLNRLRDELELISSTHPRSVNILLCHHHPHKYPDIHLPDYSHMEGGPDLLSMIGSGRYGRWLVVHGHKHFPRICYAAGSAQSPVIFSAGSFSACLTPDLQTIVRNQFYVIHLLVEPSTKVGLGLAGTFRSWDWHTGYGWRPATKSSGLPRRGGFGYRGDLFALAAQVHAEWQKAGTAWVLWAALTRAIPSLSYLLPNDFIALTERLQQHHSLSIIDQNEEPFQIGSAP